MLPYSSSLISLEGNRYRINTTVFKPKRSGATLIVERIAPLLFTSLAQ